MKTLKSFVVRKKSFESVVVKVNNYLSNFSFYVTKEKHTN
jgi:hypothetical protein